MSTKLSPAARRSIRRMMRRRPGAAHGNPLPPPGGTRAFWLREDSWGGWRAEGPAIWARLPRAGEIQMGTAPLARSPSAAIVVATRRGHR